MNNLDNIKLITTQEVGETIEMTYIETSNVVLAVHPPRPAARRVFKIIFSCKDGKWHKSDPIYGTIIPREEEKYIFE